MNPPPDDGAHTAGDTVRTRGLAAPWQPGVSGNPSGGSISALGLAAQVRQRTGNGRELLEFFMKVLHGEPIPRPGHRPLTPDLDQRITAAHWLADRGYGRAKEIIELTNEASPAQRIELLKRLSDDQRQQLRDLLQQALNGPSVTANDTADNTPALPSPTPLEETACERPPPDPAP